MKKYIQHIIRLAVIVYCILGIPAKLAMTLIISLFGSLPVYIVKMTREFILSTREEYSELTEFSNN